MLEQQIKKYWEVQPPFKGEGRPGSLEWSRSISAHRRKVTPYWERWVNASAYRGKRVFEIGVGAGSDALEFAKAGADVYGVDITKKALATAWKRFKIEQKHYSYMGQYLGDILPLISPAGLCLTSNFDLVFSGGVLHHTPHMDDLLADAWRILKPGGELKFMVYHRHSLLYYYLMYYWKYLKHDRRSREALISKYSEFRTGCPYTRCYTKDEIKDKLWFFSKVKVKADYFVFDNPATGERKIRGERLLDDTGPGPWTDCGIPDVDQFFNRIRWDFFKSKCINMDRKYGWHLLVSAWK